ncbi:MAG: hypothetical protein WC533_01480 [Candidatus Pacearchaeota archaeon]
MSGKLIVCEGLDCSGKTTAIEKVINSNPEYVYSKGIGSNSRFGRTARRFPSTFMFLSELIYNTYTRILPNLREDKTVLQDRYDVSVTSFVPNTNRRYNQLLIHVAKLLIPEPDAIVYFHLPLEERIKRLKQKGKKYELMLAENPDRIILREKEYEKWYNQFNGPKTRIDTARNNIEQTVIILEDFIKLVSE